MAYTIEPILPPAEPRPTALIEQVAELNRRCVIEHYGTDDLAEDARSLTIGLREQTYAAKPWVAIHRDTDLVGSCFLELPTKDNTSVVEWAANVDPADPDRAGVWRTLLDAADRCAADHGRSVLQGWTSHPVAADTEDVVRAASGAGFIDRDLVVDALLAHGHRLEQVERHSILLLAEHRTGFDRLHAETAAAAGPEYDVLSWAGSTPDQLLEPMARLHARMSVDVPTAGVDSEEQAWDADRLRAMDEKTAAQGHLNLVSAVRHLPTGDLVAYTGLSQSASRPAAAWQNDTLVHGEHRGHRLGLLVKLANLRSARQHAPQIERVHTWNADENEHMLAINTALGFRAAFSEAIWQRRL